MKPKHWHRGQIDSFLARGGDIKSVDRFLLRGGRIKTPQPPIADVPASDFVFGQQYNEYLNCSPINRVPSNTPDAMLLRGLAEGDLTDWDENH